MKFFSELRRRNVFKVALAYLLVAWLILQVGDVLQPALNLPEWVTSLLAFFLVLGFPLALFFAWALEWTPEGLKLEKHQEGTPAPAASSGRQLDVVIIGLLLIAAIYFFWEARFADEDETPSAQLSAELDQPADTQSAESSGQTEITDRSIAVLPFDTLGEAEPTAFTEGVHGDILTRLSRIPQLSVTSRTSVMQYREPGATLPQIARELGVTWVLQGEVQEANNEVQVNARLVHAIDDRQVWAERYRRRLSAENLFEIQSQITEEIAFQLQARLAVGHASTRIPTRDLDAYRLYIQGRESIERWSVGNLRQAVGYFRAALERDPDYALAWAGLADAVSLLRWYSYPPVEGVPEPEEAARRALEIDPDLAEAHLSRAIVLSSAEQADAPGALRSLQRAVELRPSFAAAYIWMGWLSLLVGEPEQAVSANERAVELDPLAPAARVFLAEAYLAVGMPDAALVEAVRGRELQPDHPFSHFMEALVLHHLGRYAEARAALEVTRALVPPDGTTPTHEQIDTLDAVTRAAAGGPEAAQELLSHPESRLSPVSAGLLHAALGEYQEAVAAFGTVKEWGQISNEYLRYFFPDTLGPLRQLAAYDELLRRADRSWGVSTAD